MDLHALVLAWFVAHNAVSVVILACMTSYDVWRSRRSAMEKKTRAVAVDTIIPKSGTC